MPEISGFIFRKRGIFMKAHHQVHPIQPVYEKSSRILILGSFPSVKSREAGFFYGHPQNRFWPLLAALRNEPVPVSIPDRHSFLLRHGIALWDVIASCTIEGSSDSSIRDAVPNDLSRILENADIQAIFTNGGLAGKLYDRYCFPQTGIPAIKLPSTSPANAACSLERLKDSWCRINTFLLP